MMQTTLKLFYAASNNNLLKTMVAQPTNVAPIQLNLSPRDCYFAIRHCSSRSLWSSWTHTVTQIFNERMSHQNMAQIDTGNVECGTCKRSSSLGNGLCGITTAPKGILGESRTRFLSASPMGLHQGQSSQETQDLTYHSNPTQKLTVLDDS
jgi:hypothetical protein